MGHRHEVVLAAHARHHAPVFQRIGRGRTQRGGDHAGVEEAGMAALHALQGLIASVQLVDLADPAHADRAALVVGQVAQPLVELRRAQVERTVQVLAFGLQRGVVDGQGAAVLDALHQPQIVMHLAPDHAGLHQPSEALVEHLAAAIQADVERGQPAAFEHGGVAGQARIQRVQDLPVAGVVGVPQHQRVADGVGQRADADLQRATIADQRAGIQADGVIGVADRLPRQPEQIGVGRRRGDHQVEEAHIHRGRAAEVGQLRVDLGDHQRTRQAACGHRIEGVLGDVVVARQRQPAVVRAHRHLLHDGVRRALRHRVGSVGVVEAGIAALRLRGAEQGTGLHVELFHLHVRRQAVADHRIGIGQAREVVTEMALRERRHEAGFQPAGGRLGRVQRQRGVDLQRPRRVVLDPGIQRVEQSMRFAQGQRRADAQRAVHPLQQPVGGRVEVGKVIGHPAPSCRVMRAITAFPV